MHRWLVVADSPFLPARGGGEREHLGFVTAVRDAGWLAGVVIPTSTDLPRAAYAQAVGNAPVICVRRRTSPLSLLHPTLPYVVASRPARTGLLPEVRASVGPLTGIVVFSYKSHRIGRALSVGLGVPAVLRQHNREGDYHRSLAAGSSGARRLVLRWEARRIAKDEALVDRASWLAAIADISAADAQARRAAGARNVLFVPPFAFDPTPTGGPRARRDEGRVLFLGALDVPTNTTGLDWFLRHVWPVLAGRFPEARLDVVGRAPSRQLRRRLEGMERVALHADVDSVTPYLDRASIAVNPAVTGSGVNIKLIDYVLAGLPVVSTSLATQGLPLRPGIDLEVSDDPAAFAELCGLLLSDPLRRARLATSGADHLRALLDRPRNLAVLADALAPAAGVRGC